MPVTAALQEGYQTFQSSPKAGWYLAIALGLGLLSAVDAVTDHAISDAVNNAMAAAGDWAKKKAEAVAAAMSPPAPGMPDPNNKEKKSSRNQPQTKGEPNSTQVERNPDGTVRRVTQYDEKGNMLKEIRPKPSHGSDGPTTKYPETNTNPKTGEEFTRFKVRPATPDEIKLLQ